MKHSRFAAALFAIVALAAMAMASSASAVTFLLAEWLEGGVANTEIMLVETTGSVEYMDNTAPVINKLAAVQCSRIRDGFVGPNGAAEITEILTLAGAAVSTAVLVASGLSCTNVTECASPIVWAVNLPWLTLLVLWEEGAETGFADLIQPHAGGGNPGWAVECTVLGIKVEDTCTAPEAAASITNVATGVLGVFSVPFTELMGLKLVTCGGGGETGQLEGEGEVTVNSLGTLLSASSE
jgi:hypothetical protein